MYADQNEAGGTFNLTWSQLDKPSNDDFINATNLVNLVTSGSVALTNQNATRQTGEPTHIGTSSKSVWMYMTSNQLTDYSITMKTESPGLPGLDTTLSVYSGANFSNLVPVAKNDDLGFSKQSGITFVVKSGGVYRIAVDRLGGSTTGSVIVSWNITKVRYTTDFNPKNAATAEVFDDAATDIAVFRPANGTWYWLDSSDDTFHYTQFGQSGDVPVQGDYDGDGRTDLAVTRNVNNVKTWYIRNSFDNSERAVPFGVSLDKPVPGDYDNDGIMDIAVFRPITGTWYILRSKDGQVVGKQFGSGTDIPVSSLARLSQ